MIIETNRLILRPFEREDAYDLYEYLNKPQVNCFSCMKVDNIAESYDECVKRSLDKEFYFAITLKENGKVIGEIDASGESTNPDNENAIIDTYSPCWMLNKNYQGYGYAYEAVKAFFDYLFNVKNARRIYVYTEDYNISCQKLCKRLGLRKEAEFLEFVSFVNDENGNPIYENTWQYAVLKKEWNKK